MNQRKIIRGALDQQLVNRREALLRRWADVNSDRDYLNQEMWAYISVLETTIAEDLEPGLINSMNHPSLIRWRSDVRRTRLPFEASGSDFG